MAESDRVAEVFKKIVNYTHNVSAHLSDDECYDLRIRLQNGIGKANTKQELKWKQRKKF